MKSERISNSHGSCNKIIEILWTKTVDGACIHRVFSQEMFLALPESIEGFPVTELAPYCFSSTEKYTLNDSFLTCITKRTEVDHTKEEKEEERIQNPSMPQVAGKYLEGIILPDNLLTIGNGAFYGCRMMRSISMGTNLYNLGSDVFTNCLRLNQVTIRGDFEEKCVLSHILDRIQTEVDVRFQSGDGQDTCRLFFPECNEWFDDMVTAHVFNRVIVGEGFRMRQCFQDHKIQFSKYDQCFAGSIKMEGNREICLIAMNRLRWPVHLKEEDEVLYAQAIRDRYDTLIQIIISSRDMDLLRFLCQYFEPEGSILTGWMTICIQADWTEGNAFLMEEKHKGRTFADKSFDFEDWDAEEAW